MGKSIWFPNQWRGKIDGKKKKKKYINPKESRVRKRDIDLMDQIKTTKQDGTF